MWQTREKIFLKNAALKKLNANKYGLMHVISLDYKKMSLVLEIITSTNFDFWTLQCILEMFGSQSLESNCTNSIIRIILLQPNLYL